MNVLTFREGARPDELLVDLYDPLAGDSVTPQLLKSWTTPGDVYAWMENLYLKKGGKATAFNCWSVRLTAEDLDALEEAVRTDNLTGMPGVTFCDAKQCEQQDEDALALIAMGKMPSAEGTY